MTRVLLRYRKALLGTLFFVAALWIYRTEIQRLESRPARRYLSVKRAISAGTPVYLPDLAANLSQAPALPGQLSDQDLAWLQGAQFRNALAADAAVRWEDLLLSPKWVGVSSRIPTGLRAVEVETSGAHHVRLGDWIDLYQSTEVVAEAVRVLDADAKSTRLTVGISPEMVDLVQSAKNQGPFEIVVRNPAESEQTGRGSRWKKGKRPKAAPAIPVLVE